jgi:ATP-dependent exoDNAse (exonuclease V) alpha subunit
VISWDLGLHFALFGGLPFTFLKAPKQALCTRTKHRKMTNGINDANSIAVELENGSTATYEPRRLRGVNVFREVEREFAIGDRLQWTAPNKELGVANRDLGTVVGLEQGKMAVRMDSKPLRLVTFDTSEFRQFDHGYAVTSHSSQGLTAGRVLVHIDTETSRSLINARLAYVSLSRASDDARVLSNDASTLAERLSVDTTKSVAVHFQRSIDSDIRVGSAPPEPHLPVQKATGYEVPQVSIESTRPGIER